MELLTLRPMIWLLAIVAMAIGLRYSLVDRPRWRRATAIALRASGVLLLILALCRPFWKEESHDLHVVFLVDVSQSVDLDGAIKTAADVRSFTEALRPADSWSLFSVADGVRHFEDAESLKAVLDQWQAGLADDRFRSASRLAESLLETRLAFPSGKSRRVVLFSDGQETHADVAAALRQMSEDGIDVRFCASKASRRRKPPWWPFNRQPRMRSWAKS